MSQKHLMRPHGQSLAIVVFGPSSLSYLQLLRTGYQHCCVATQAEGMWQMLDPLSNGTEMTILGYSYPEEIINEFERDGYEAIAVQRRPFESREMPLAPYTCVEAVKRVLGIRARWVLTPWQLRQHILKHQS